MTETLDAAERTADATAAPTPAGIRAATAPVLADLASTARRREGTRDHPFEQVRALAAARLAVIGIPAQDGGAGGTIRDVAEVVIDLARADSHVAQALRPTFLNAHQVTTRADLPNRTRSLERLLRGDLFAGTGNERFGGASGSVHTTVRREGTDYVLNGTKYYSTGGLYADWFAGTAVDEDGEIVSFTVPTDRPGVELLDDFDAIGQGLTASGTTRLSDVRVTVDELVRTDRSALPNPWLGTFAQLYLASIEAGIAAAAFDDAVSFGRTKARPIKHSTAQTSVDDPYVRHVVGRIAAHAHAARSAVLLAAESVEQVRHAPAEQVRALGAEAAVVVAQAQYLAVESALQAAELLFDVGGGSATDRSLALDRHWRNARTVANHNPRDWKAAVVGGYYLAGEEPPTTGLF